MCVSVCVCIENYTVSIGWFASAVENGNLNGSHLIDYATFDRECLHRVCFLLYFVFFVCQY